MATVGTGSRISLNHLHAANFPLLITGKEPAAFEVTHSRVSSTGARFDVDADVEVPGIPAGSVLQGNEFVNTTPLQVSTSGPERSIVEGNRWSRVDDYYASSGVVLRGSGHVSFTGNAFETGPWTALSVRPEPGPTRPSPTITNAEGNYWGAVTPSAIGERIYDQEDVPIIAVLVDFEPFLTEPPQATIFTPLPPSDVAAVRAGSGSASVTWPAPLSDGGAPVSRYTVTAQPGGQQVTVGGSARQATLTGLTDGVPHTFRVTASNSRGVSLPSVPSDSVTPLAPPSTPVLVKVVAGVRQATVSWAAVTGATSYRVTASGGRSATVSASATEGVVTGLVGGRSYRFTVVALNSSGSSALSTPSASVIVIGRPDRVRKLRAVVKSTRGGKMTVRLSWKAPRFSGSPITSYRVTSSKGVASRKVPASKRSVVLKNLKTGKYAIGVRASNAAGITSWRALVTVKPPAKR